MIVRPEHWGAWVKLESMPAVVALDRDGVRALGLDGGAVWEGEPRASAPVEVHLAVTAKCAAGCEGCYLDATPNGEEPPIAALVARLDALREAGVFTVAFGGGEPTTRSDLGELALLARARGITPVVTTSGLGLTAAKVEALRACAQVNVSYDGEGEAYAKVRGFDAAERVERAIATLCEAGIKVGVNIVLTRDTFSSLPDTVRRVRALGACEAQLLRYKPAGHAASLDYLARRLTPSQADSLGPTLAALHREHATIPGPFSIRIDCALVPFLSADPEITRDPSALTRFGVFGCQAADALLAVRVDGRVAPCSFSPPATIQGEDLARSHEGDPELERWRAYGRAPDEPCASCTLFSVCRGGCKVVASFIDRAHGPDPECPRVRAPRAAMAGNGAGAPAA